MGLLAAASVEQCRGREKGAGLLAAASVEQRSDGKGCAVSSGAREPLKMVRGACRACEAMLRLPLMPILKSLGAEQSCMPY